jgi:flagellar basal-body rod modification protein FlgD
MTTVPSTTSTPSATSSTDTTALGRNQLVQNFDTFLTLLTTQMKNQDPLSPMDSTQFTQQLVQMTGVEQQLASNDLLKQLVSNTGANVASAVGLIGKQVVANSPTAQLQNSTATWQYTLGPGASDVKIEVLDSNGNSVAVSAPDDNSAGDHSFTWDGRSTTGKAMPDGAYTLRITAKDPGGNTVSATPFIQGVVSGVEQSDSGTVLTIGGAKVPLSAVMSVAEPPASATNNNSNTNTAGQTPAAAA